MDRKSSIMILRIKQSDFLIRYKIERLDHTIGKNLSLIPICIKEDESVLNTPVTGKSGHI